MALGATIYHFEVRLANVERAVYETLSLKLARHPSESDEHLVARLLAFCLEHTDGIAFSKGGLSDPDEPPIAEATIQESSQDRPVGISTPK